MSNFSFGNCDSRVGTAVSLQNLRRLFHKLIEQQIYLKSVIFADKAKNEMQISLPHP